MIVTPTELVLNMKNNNEQTTIDYNTKGWFIFINESIELYYLSSKILK